MPAPQNTDGPSRTDAGDTLHVVEGTRTPAEAQLVSKPSVGLRPYGLCAGEFEVPPDFDDPLLEEILSTFEGSDPGFNGSGE